jgi:SprT protein
MNDVPVRDDWAARLPAGLLPHVAPLIAGHRVTIRLSRPRRSKLGDHRPPGRGIPHHRITVNDNLNPYAFLTTLLHEIAHVTTWEKLRLRGRRYPPHGREWKREFAKILEPAVAGGMLPDDITAALAAYMQNPAAASCSDRGLMLALARYDRGADDRPRVEELETGAVFRVDNGLVFRLHRRLRSRFQCFELSSGREYRVHGLCRVDPVLEPPRRPRLKVGRPSGCRK